jgi:hypothetical protein
VEEVYLPDQPRVELKGFSSSVAMGSYISHAKTCVKAPERVPFHTGINRLQ